jgi:hypothetical protein
MITRVGSQNREPIADTVYRVTAVLSARQIVLVDTTDGHCELWIACDHNSGYVIEYGSTGYEFVHDYRDCIPKH